MSVDLKKTPIQPGLSAEHSNDPFSQLGTGASDAASRLRANGAQLSDSTQALIAGDVQHWRDIGTLPVGYAQNVMTSTDLYESLGKAIRTGNAVTLLLHPLIVNENGLIPKKCRIELADGQAEANPQQIDLLVGKIAYIRRGEVDGVNVIRIGLASVDESLTQRYCGQINRSNQFAREHQTGAGLIDVSPVNTKAKEIVVLDGSTRFPQFLNYATEPSPFAKAINGTLTHLGVLSVSTGAPMMTN